MNLVTRYISRAEIIEYYSLQKTLEGYDVYRFSALSFNKNLGISLERMKKIINVDCDIRIFTSKRYILFNDEKDRDIGYESLVDYLTTRDYLN